MAASGPYTVRMTFPLHEAAKIGDIDAVRQLLESKIYDINEMIYATIWDLDDEGRTPLHYAVEGGHCNVVDLLIQHGADPYRSRLLGWTPLHSAARRGYFDVAALLIQHGADPCSVNLDGRTPLHCTVWGGHFDVAALLIQHGADPSSMDCNGKTPLHYAVVEGHCNIAAHLLQHGADPCIADRGGGTPLHYAAQRGRYLVALLLQHGADPCIADMDGETPLHYAAGVCRSIVDLLIQHGADPCITDKAGKSPLHYAARVGSSDVAALLIQHEADSCIADKDGKTPLHYAAMSGHSDLVALLIQHGADPCSVDSAGRTPLHGAAKGGPCDEAALYMQNRAYKYSLNSAGRTPLHGAAKGGPCDVTALLIHHRADPCSVDWYGWTPLHYAAWGGNSDVAALLIQHGADPCSTNKDGRTPLYYAADCSYCDVVALLIQHGADTCSIDWVDIRPFNLTGDNHALMLLLRFKGDHILEFMIMKTLEHVSAKMSLDDFFLPTDGINGTFPYEVQKQKVQRLRKWAYSNNFKTIQGIKAGLTAQGREKLCVIAAEHYATIAKDIIDMSSERYNSFCEDLSTAQFMFQEHPLLALETQSQEISMELESYQYDVFLIHSGEDEAKVEKVLKQLEALGIRCCYAPRDFPLGKRIFSCIEDAVDLSRCTVVMVSENFMNSEWCQHEREVAETKAKDTKGRYLVIPVLLDFEPSDLPRAYSLRKYIRADSQDFIPKLVETIKGPTAAPSYGQLRSENEALKQEREGMSQQLQDATALIGQLRANLESMTV